MRIKYLIPAVQVCIAAIALSSVRWADGAILTQYVFPAQDAVLKLNSPLALFWTGLLYVLDSLSHNVTDDHRAAVIAGWFLRALVLSSVAVFWYFMVSEWQARHSGRSMIRFSNLYAETAKQLLLLLFGVAAIFYAWVDTASLLRMHRNIWFALSGAAFLVTWGALSLGTAIVDIKVFFHRNGSERAT